MIDVNEFSYEMPSDEGITVYHDVYDGFSLLGRIRGGGRAGVCIEENDTMDGRFFDEEDSRHRIFLGGCRLEVDPTSTIDVKADLPIGAVVIAPNGVTVVARGYHGRSAAFLAVIGEVLADRFDGFAFSRWTIVRDKPGQPPAVIFAHSAGGLFGE